MQNVLVIGLYRSGTSALAKLLYEIGYNFGNHLIPANIYNPNGYFEDLSLVVLSEEILDKSNGRYSLLRDKCIEDTDLYHQIHRIFSKSSCSYAVKLPHATFYIDKIAPLLKNMGILTILMEPNLKDWKISISKYDKAISCKDIDNSINALEHAKEFANIIVNQDDLRGKPEVVKKTLKNLLIKEEGRTLSSSSPITNTKLSPSDPIDIGGLSFQAVSKGSFLFGSNYKDLDASPHEHPQKTIHTNSYCISTFAITNKIYKEVMTDDADREGFIESIDTRLIEEELPATGVTFWEAKTFCDKFSKINGCKIRLPSEIEWEKAARGWDGRIWSWGNNRPEGRANFNAIIGRTIPVHHLQEYSSPFGLVQASGNCWEWTSTEYPNTDNNYTRRLVLKGGSFMNHAPGIRCADRSWSTPEFRSIDYGFRVVCEIED